MHLLKTWCDNKSIYTLLVYKYLNATCYDMNNYYPDKNGENTTTSSVKLLYSI